MKKLKTILSALVMGVVAISLTGCQNEEEETYAVGKGISFQCASESHGTRAAYSGAETSGAIVWNNGDKIRIYCEQSNKPASHYSDYTITGTTASGTISNAGKTDSLCWGPNGPHDFYAVYPAPGDSWVTSIAGKTVKGTVKAAQDGNRTFDNGMVMVAKNTVTTPSAFNQSAVFLRFSPITTAITFTILNGQTSDMNVEYVQLVSKDHPISGDFTWNIGEGKVQDDLITDDEKKVKISYSPLSKPLNANKGNSLTFTFFLRPDDDLDDLSIVVKPEDSDAYTSKLQTTEGPFTFKKGTKTVIGGVVLEKKLTLMSISPISTPDPLSGFDFRGDGKVEEEILF